MADFSVTELIVGGVTSLGAISVGVREYLKRERVSNAADNAQIGGLGANAQVIAAMREELNRLAVRVDVLEKQVDALQDKLAGVKMIAIDCYAIASKQPHSQEQQTLLDHLKQIIKEA